MKNLHIRLLMMSLVLVGAFIVIMIGLSDEADAAQPVATVKLDTAEQTAKVGPGDTGIVRFTGTVDVLMIGPGSNVQMIVVTLSADSGWATTITPTVMSFNAQALTQKIFEVIVKVPNFTSFQTVGSLSITGTVGAKPGAVTYKVPETKGIITIAPYFMVTVSCEEPYIEISPGDPLLFSMKIKNEGNTKDRLNIDITNDDELAKAEWVVTLGTRTLFIDESKEDVVKVAVTSPQDWTLYRNRVTKVDVIVKSITSTSSGSGAAPESQEYAFFIRDKGIYIPGFEPLFALMALVIVAAAMKKFRH